MDTIEDCYSAGRHELPNHNAAMLVWDRFYIEGMIENMLSHRVCVWTYVLKM
jgi:hypothetical protein